MHPTIATQGASNDEKRASQGPTPEELDIDVVMWSSKVLPSDDPGLSDQSNWYDPHKYRFCLFLSACKAVRRVTIICPSRSERTPREIHHGGGLFVRRISLARDRPALAILQFNLHLAWRALRYGKHISYFYDDGEAIPFVIPMLLLRIRGFPTVLDYRNPPLVHQISEAVRRRRGPAFLAEILACKLAALVVALSPACARIISDSFRRTPLLVPSSVSPSFHRPPSVVFGRGELIRFVYWGSLDERRKLDELVLGFVEACRRDPKKPRELLLVGNGNDAIRLAEIAGIQNDAQIHVLTWHTEEALLDILDAATVSVIAVPASDEDYVASYPLKLVEALALGRPILASDIPVARIVEERQIGVVARHERRSYADAFLAFDRESVERFVSNIQLYADRTTSHLPENVFAPVLDWLTVSGGTRPS